MKRTGTSVWALSSSARHISLQSSAKVSSQSSVGGQQIPPSTMTNPPGSRNSCQPPTHTPIVRCASVPDVISAQKQQDSKRSSWRWEDEVENLGSDKLDLSFLSLGSLNDTFVHDVTSSDDEHESPRAIEARNDIHCPSYRHLGVNPSGWHQSFGEKPSLAGSSVQSYSSISTACSSLRSRSAGSQLEFDSLGGFGNWKHESVEPFENFPDTFATNDSGSSRRQGLPRLIPSKSPKGVFSLNKAHENITSCSDTSQWYSFSNPSVACWEVSQIEHFQVTNGMHPCAGLVGVVQAGFLNGQSPIMVETPCTGGVYFTKGPNGRIVGVMKPADEEPYAAHNPHGYLHPSENNEQRDGTTLEMKSGIIASHGIYREVAAFLVDHNSFASVPKTTLIALKPQVRISTSEAGRTQSQPRYASLQAYMSHDCTAEDVGSSLLPSDTLHRIVILDIRLFNKDRHPGNILMRTKVNKLCFSSDDDSDDNEAEIGDDEVMEQHYTNFGTSESCDLTPRKLSRAKTTGPVTQNIERSSVSKLQSCFGRRRHMRYSQRLIRRKSKSFHESDFESATAKVTLIPIDHGYCLPSIYNLDNDDFAWMQWKQSSEPIAQSSKDYIAQLDPFKDCRIIQTSLGREAIPESCLLTLIVCTRLLQIAVVEYNLNLNQVGRMMCRGQCQSDQSPVSTLEVLVQRSLPPNPSDIHVLNKNGNLDTCTKEFVERFEGQVRAYLGGESCETTAPPVA